MFTESLTEIGSRLEQAQDAYDTARNLLVNGRGNIISRPEILKELWAKAKKSIPDSLTVQATGKPLSSSDSVK